MNLAQSPFTLILIGSTGLILSSFFIGPTDDVSAIQSLAEVVRGASCRQWSFSQLPKLARPLCRQSHQHICETGKRIMPIHVRRLNQAHDRHRPFAK
jgi:hypothetical protein